MSPALTPRKEEVPVAQHVPADPHVQSPVTPRKTVSEPEPEPDPVPDARSEAVLDPLALEALPDPNVIAALIAELAALEDSEGEDRARVLAQCRVERETLLRQKCEAGEAAARRRVAAAAASGWAGVLCQAEHDVRQGIAGQASEAWHAVTLAMFMRCEVVQRQAVERLWRHVLEALWQRFQQKVVTAACDRLLHEVWPGCVPRGTGCGGRLRVRVSFVGVV